MGSCTSATRARTPLAESSWESPRRGQDVVALTAAICLLAPVWATKKYPFHDDAGPCLGSAHVRAAFVQACSPRQFVVSCIAERVRLYNHQLLCLPGRMRGTHGMQDFGPARRESVGGVEHQRSQPFSCLLRARLLPSPRSCSRFSRGQRPRCRLLSSASPIHS